MKGMKSAYELVKEREVTEFQEFMRRGDSYYVPWLRSSRMDYMTGVLDVMLASGSMTKEAYEKEFTKLREVFYPSMKRCEAIHTKGDCNEDVGSISGVQVGQGNSWVYGEYANNL